MGIRSVLAAAALCVCFAAQSLAQMTFTAQNRFVTATAPGGGVPQTITAPNYFSFNQSVSVPGVGGTPAAAAQASSPGGLIITTSGSANPGKNGAGQFGTATSTCSLTFTVVSTCSFTMTSNFGSATITLMGPGVSVSRTGNGTATYDTGKFLAGQTYVYTCTTSGANVLGSPTTGSYNSTLAITGFGATAVDHSFPYQGVVKDAGGQAIGTPTDFRFSLYSAASGGDQIGATEDLAALPVSNGTFTATLNFGNVYDGGERWLEIALRNPAGSGSYTTIAGRTKIQLVPYADYALSAGSVEWEDVAGVPAVLPPWEATDTGIHYGGNVGIGSAGTAEPSFPLHVKAADGFGFVHTAPESGVELGTYANPSAGWFGTMSNHPLYFYVNNEPDPQMVIDTEGRVGIGTAAPTEQLHVIGNVLANNVAVPSSIRFKDHVAPMDDALDSLLRLEGVRFDWKPEWAKQRPGREHDIGFVAEDVAKIFPEVVFRDARGNVTGMDYSRLTAVAVQAIKQQQKQITERDAKIAELEARLRKIEEKLDAR